MGTVAGAEPSAEVTGVGGGDATKVGADANQNHPLGVLAAVLILLGVAEVDGVVGPGGGNLLSTAVGNEYGLTSPFDSDSSTLSNTGGVDFDGTQG